MSQSIQDSTRATLRSYMQVVRGLSNELAIRERVSALIAELFSTTNAVADYVHSSERRIRISMPGATKRGRADSYYGKAVIEFEASLKRSLPAAENQLREYIAGLWEEKGADEKLLAVASDGIVWRTYKPVLKTGSPLAPENVHLELLSLITVAEDTLDAFWLWLTSFLFREQQQEPTTERIQFDFGSNGILYSQGLAALKTAWATARKQSEARLAFDTWRRYLTITYGSLTESVEGKKDLETGTEISDLELFFLRHTYLSSLARLMVWAALSRGKNVGDLRTVAQEVFSGAYFKASKLANLSEDDFFHWIRSDKAELALGDIWAQVLTRLLEYDLSAISQDVLKGVYQQLIGPKERHDLGEYYTPDWLCERIVAEMLPAEGYKSVLDPSCGSGSFLRASISHFLAHNTAGSDQQRLGHILANVCGIDIHPVAVIIARATYVLALGKLVNKASKPIQIPIFLADSLFLPHEVEKDLYSQLSGIRIAYGASKDQREFVMPEMLVRKPELFDDAIAACALLASEHAKKPKESSATLDRYLQRNVPALHMEMQYPAILEALWSFTNGLAHLIRERKNSIWSFIIRNSYRPAMLRGQFDIIVGNPPWLSYRYITDPDYQKEIKLRALTTYKIAPKSQKLFTQMELATVFLAHSMATFARSGARLAFVMPRSVLTADQHQNLIRRTYASAAKFSLSGYWDLWDVKPLFNVPSCVLFAKHKMYPVTGDAAHPLDVLEWSGTLPKRDVPWSRAEAALSFQKKRARVVYLGTRAAFSTEVGSKAQTKGSPYAKAFKQGATLVPRNLFFVKIHGANGGDFDFSEAYDPNTLFWASTDEEQARQSKPPYTDVRIKGQVEAKFVFATALSKHLVPFALLQPTPVVLPLEESKDHALSMATVKRLEKEGYRHFAQWMEKAQTIWDEKRGTKASAHSLLEWLDYSGKLTAQDFSQRHLVLYNASGTNVSAAYFDRRSCKLHFVVDHKTYWAAFSDRREAHFITAFLNSDTANQKIKPFQSTGLLGERDVHKTILAVPIPTFNPDNARHIELADLSATAHEIALKLCKSAIVADPASIARKRSFVRESLKDEMLEMDALVSELLQS